MTSMTPNARSGCCTICCHRLAFVATSSNRPARGQGRQAGRWACRQAGGHAGRQARVFNLATRDAVGGLPAHCRHTVWCSTAHHVRWHRNMLHSVSHRTSVSAGCRTLTYDNAQRSQSAGNMNESTAGQATAQQMHQNVEVLPPIQSGCNSCHQRSRVQCIGHDMAELCMHWG